MKHFYYYTRDTESWTLWSRYPGREDVVWGSTDTEEQAIADTAWMTARFG